MLTKETTDDKQLYRFYSHFDPSWSDLVWNASFPQLIYGLIDPAVSKGTINNFDERVIGESQIQLTTTADKTHTGIQDTDTTDAKHILWAIIFVLFLIERFLSFQSKKERVYA